MKRFAAENLFARVLLGAAMCNGCGEKTPAEAPKVDEPAAETGADVDVMGLDIEKNLANLSDEDRALALKQKVCPVTKEPLGSMGEPIKIEKDGEALFVCCEGCKDKVETNFAEYFAEFGGAQDEMKDETVEEGAN
jgi:hypothetical protein